MKEFELVRDSYNDNTYPYERLNWHDCELFHTAELVEILSECDQIIHAAGLISYSKRDKAKLIHSNQELTASVVDASLAAEINHFVLVSSTGALQKRDGLGLINEDLEWDSGEDHTFYGYTKYLGEKEVFRGAEEGLAFSILNPGVILGYGDWSKSSLKLFNNARGSFPFYSTGTTGFIGVSDLCRIITHSLEKGGMDQRVCCITENRSFEEIARTMAKEFGVAGPRVKVSGMLYQLIRSLMWIKDNIGVGGMLSSESAKSAISDKPYNNNRLLDTIDFPLQEIDAVIAEACSAFKKNSPPR